MNTLKQYEEFRDHNKQVKIIAGEWLDAEKQSIRVLDDRTFLRFVFEDGSKRTLRRETVHFANKRGFKPRWKV